MSRDDELVANIRDELSRDPGVDDRAVAVRANDARITLRGTVGSLRERREARKAAQRVFGVVAVDNQLHVELLDGQKRADADLRGAVLQALALDSAVPGSVDVRVEDGLVRLIGTAHSQDQRDAARFVASSIADALDVFDEIELRRPAPTR